jgi:hypothetical protein
MPAHQIGNNAVVDTGSIVLAFGQPSFTVSFSGAEFKFTFGSATQPNAKALGNRNYEVELPARGDIGMVLWAADMTYQNVPYKIAVAYQGVEKDGAIGHSVTWTISRA